ncbi:hypothetical protein V2J09_022919 [Rumex salicifolius]
MASTSFLFTSASPAAGSTLSLQRQTKGKVKLVGLDSSAFLRGEKRNGFIKVKSFSRVSMVAAVNVSRFDGIEMAPPDPILGVSEAFKADTNELKLNLGVGAYRTEELQPYVLDVVKKAENLMLERGENKEYLPIEGLAAFNKATAELLFGADNPLLKEQKVATIQGLSGTGSLRLAAALIERNHKNIFNDAKVPWSEYRYYDPKTVGLDFEGMIADIKAAPNGSFILLHGCAHNPTGIDPTPEQWEKIADVIQEKNHIPFFDVAYQGFASGSLDEDASSVRLFAARGMEIFVAQSYSKNLGLYAERIGALNVVCSSAEAAASWKLGIAFRPKAGGRKLRSQLKRIARPMYSNPPVHGARIVANVVGSPDLFNEWKEEMEMMAGRIKSVRQKLYDSLSAKDKSGKDWSFILKQIGMFSFTGLNKTQSESMSNKWHVYMTKDGRISLAGLSSAKCEYLADAILDSYYNVS